MVQPPPSEPSDRPGEAAPRRESAPKAGPTASGSSSRPTTPGSPTTPGRPGTPGSLTGDGPLSRGPAAGAAQAGQPGSENSPTRGVGASSTEEPAAESPLAAERPPHPEREPVPPSHPATVTALLAPLLLVVLLLGSSLVGLTVFAGTDILTAQAPWNSEATTLATPYNQCASDVVDARLPAAIEARSRLLAGDFPWWSSLAVAGGPLAATAMEGVISPIALPLLLLPPSLFPGFLKFAEIALTLFGGFLLGRRLKLSVASSLLLGTAFVGSGFMILWTGWPQTQTAAFFPLGLWAVERVLQDRTWRSVVPLPFVLSGMVLGGFPVLVVYFGYFAAVWSAVRLVSVWREDGARAVGRVAVLGLAGVAATVLLTAWSLVPLARRIDAVDTTTRLYTYPYDLNLAELSTFFFGESIGNCQADTLLWAETVPIEASAFAGLGVALLAVVALLGPRPRAIPAGVIALLAVVGVLGLVVSYVQGPIAEFVGTLPGKDSSPLSRLRSIGGLAFAILAAIGFDTLLRRPPRRREARALLLVLGLAATVYLAWLTLIAAEDATPTNELWAGVQHTVWVAGLSGVLVLVATGLYLFGAGRPRRVALALVPLAIALEIGLFAHAFWPRSEPETYYPETPVHELLQENLGSDRSAAVGTALFRGAETAYGIRSLTGHEFAPVEFLELVETADPLARRTSPTVVTLTPWTVDSPVFDRFGVRYIVASTTISPAGTPIGDQGRGLPAFEITAGDRLTREVAGRTPDAGVIELVRNLTEPLELRALTLNGELPTGCENTIALPPGTGGAVTVPLPGPSCDAPATTLAVDIVTGATSVLTDSVTREPWLGAVELPPDLALVEVEGAVVYENLDNLGRIRWADSAVVAPDPDAARELLASGKLDPGETVVVAGPEGQSPRLPPLSEQDATITVVEDSGDRIVAEVVATGEGLLVVADGIVGEWRATVNGEAVEILTVETAFAAVAVPAGRHEVVLQYDDRDERWRLVVAAVTAMGLLAMGEVLRRRRVPPNQGVSTDLDPL